VGKTLGVMEVETVSEEIAVTDAASDVVAVADASGEVLADAKGDAVAVRVSEADSLAAPDAVLRALSELEGWGEYEEVTATLCVALAAGVALSTGVALWERVGDAGFEEERDEEREDVIEKVAAEEVDDVSVLSTLAVEERDGLAVTTLLALAVGEVDGDVEAKAAQLSVTLPAAPKP
jgi:hypothetical protein